MLSSTICGAAMYLVSDFLFHHFESVTPQNAVFWGSLGAIVLCTPYFFRSTKSRKKLQVCVQKHGNVLLSVSLITSFAAFLWWYTLEQTNSGIIALIGKSETIFAFILGVFFLKEKISLSEMLGILVALTGFVFLSTLKGEMSLFLVSLMLICRFLYALQSFLIKKFASDIDGFAFGFLRLILMLIFLGSFFGFQGKIEMIPILAIVTATSALMLNAIVAKMLYFEAHKYLKISKLNMFLILQPVFILFGAFIFFGDHISSQKMVGAALILGGLAYFSWEQGRLKTQK